MWYNVIRVMNVQYVDICGYIHANGIPKPVPEPMLRI